MDKIEQWHDVIDALADPSRLPLFKRQRAPLMQPLDAEEQRALEAMARAYAKRSAAKPPAST